MGLGKDFAHFCNFLVSIPKWYIFVIPWPFGIRLTYMPTPLGIYIRQILRGHGITKLHNLYSNIFSVNLDVNQGTPILGIYFKP